MHDADGYNCESHGDVAFAAAKQHRAVFEEGEHDFVQQKQDHKRSQDERNDPHRDHTMRAVAIYLRERFPIVLTLLMSVSFAALSVGLFSPTEPLSGRWWFEIALLTALYEALLLRYRVTDEWKDFAHDSAIYPERPLQRGAISVTALLLLGSGALFVELLAVTLLGGVVALLLYLPVLALSALTAVEFGAKRWMTAHFTASFVLHELIYIPLFAWVAFVLGATPSLATVCGVLGAMLAFVSIEIVRKFEPRFAPDASPVADSYTVVWGRSTTLALLVLLMIAAGALLAVAAGIAPIIVSVVAVISVLLLRRSDKAVIATAGAHLPLLGLAVLL